MVQFGDEYAIHYGGNHLITSYFSIKLASHRTDPSENDRYLQFRHSESDELSGSLDGIVRYMSYDCMVPARNMIVSSKTKAK